MPTRAEERGRLEDKETHTFERHHTYKRTTNPRRSAGTITGARTGFIAVITKNVIAGPP